MAVWRGHLAQTGDDLEHNVLPWTLLCARHHLASRSRLFSGRLVVRTTDVRVGQGLSLGRRQRISPHNWPDYYCMRQRWPMQQKCHTYGICLFQTKLARTCMLRPNNFPGRHQIPPIRLQSIAFGRKREACSGHLSFVHICLH
jgi:hypothetical protein